MSQTKYTFVPRNELPRANPYVNELDLSSHEDSVRHWLLREAIEKPYQRIVRYFEENGYEYEMFAMYNPDSKIMRTTLYCPVAYSHHIGQTCKVCGQHG